MLYIDALEITDAILDKIEGKHGVRLWEVEEAVFAPERHIRRGREGLYQVFSRTEDGRYLLVILADHGDGVWAVVTARDMTNRERGLFRSVRR